MTLEKSVRNLIRDIPDFPKEGIVFKDITPLFQNQAVCNQIVDSFAAQYANTNIDAIVGIESRGFLFGLLLANKMNVPFVLVRKKGKLPYETVSEDYDLEYGTATIEMQIGDLKPNWNVLIHDDLLATGGTASATAKLILNQGANVVGFSFIIDLSFLNGKEKLTAFHRDIYSIVTY